MAKKSPAKILKDKGLIPSRWDLRQTLTSGQKSWLTKQMARYEAVIEKPSKFTTRTYSATTARKLKAAGYYGEGNKILIPNFGDPTSRTRVSEKTVTITRRLNPKHGAPHTVTETVYLDSGPALLARLNKRFADPLPKGEYWAFKVGDNNTFLNNHNKTLGALMHYGMEIKFKGSDGQVEWAQSHVHLVKFRYDDGLDHSGADYQLPYNYDNPTEYRPNRSAPGKSRASTAPRKKAKSKTKGRGNK